MQIEYTERVALRKCHYKLDDDQIVISGKTTFGSEFEAEVPISGLRKEKGMTRTRTDAKMALSGLPGVVAMILLFVFNEPIINVSVYLFYSLLALSIILVGTGFLFSKKKKSYFYSNQSGAFAFVISESGNSIDDFEAFCEAIECKIKAHQSASSNTDKSHA